MAGKEQDEHHQEQLMIYRFRDGYRGNVTAQVAGERLDYLRGEHGDSVTAAIVVDDARPDDSPLHPVFTWDDEEAAERYREEQARHLIRNVWVVHETAEGRQSPVLGYVSVNVPDEGPRYVTTARAMSDVDLKAQAEADALAAFESLRKRYAHIRSLSGVFAELDRVIAKARRKSKRTVKSEVIHA